jgi:hypothetical protein
VPFLDQVKYVRAVGSRQAREAGGGFHPGRVIEVASVRGGMSWQGDIEAANGETMSGTGWGILLGCIYLVLIFVFAVLSFRKGHWVLGLIGFVFPILWIIGAMLPSRYARR